MPYACKKCGKVYKNNGKWLKKHMVEKCHVMRLIPIELVEKQDIDLTTIMNRINHIEFMIKNTKVQTKYHDDPIERIKIEEAQKIHDPALKHYRQAFAECIIELKNVLELRKEQLDNEIDISQLTIMR